MFFLGFLIGASVVGLVSFWIGKRLLMQAMHDVSGAFELMGEAFTRVLEECKRIDTPTPAMRTAVDHAYKNIRLLQKVAGVDEQEQLDPGLEQEEQIG
jgi:hypothetical protein